MLSASQASLHQRALDSSRRYKASHRELLAVIIEVDEARLYQAFNLTSTYSYCRELLGLTEDIACSFTAVARKARVVPELKAAVDDGLDFSKAKLAARILTPQNQEKLLRVAKESSCKQLEREIVKDHPRAAVRETVRLVAEDRHKLELGLSEELLKQLRRSQDLVSGKQRKAVSLEETLAVLLALYLEREDPVRKAERARPKPVSNPKGEKIPATSLHAVNLRDRGRCQEDGCESTRFTEIHHIIPRAGGGGHDPSNLTTLCSAHHRARHRQGGDPSATWRINYRTSMLSETAPFSK